MNNQFVPVEKDANFPLFLPVEISLVNTQTVDLQPKLNTIMKINTITTIAWFSAMDFVGARPQDPMTMEQAAMSEPEMSITGRRPKRSMVNWENQIAGMQTR